jgi:hypothetical protein
MELIKKLDLHLLRIEKMILIHQNELNVLAMIDMLTSAELLETFGVGFQRDFICDYEMIERIMLYFTGHFLVRVKTPAVVTVNKNGVRKFAWDEYAPTRLFCTRSLENLLADASAWADSIHKSNQK